ncbi:hypothetical protein AB0M02_06415 [Actinoplanes sp. NPDC051861]|uniref:hypothetical protein n=1 Tax=Actinoplanes sp. NPDC051861 TaxID=3155170 RepID=UPI003445959B
MSPWIALPLCMITLLAIGELWWRALAGPGPLGEAGVPVTRIGFAAVAGLATLPLVALALHAAAAPVRPLPLVVGGAIVATVLGLVALLRERLTGPRPGLPAQRVGSAAAPVPDPAGSGGVRTAVAVTVPAVLVLAIGGVAVRAHLGSPRPTQPGYLSVALNGWAAAIDSPVTVPARGLSVPVRVTSSGLGTMTELLSLRIGGRVITSRPVTVAADTVQAMAVRVPAMPADGCLRAVSISVGPTSAGFYARGPVTAPATRPGRAALLRGRGAC